MSDSIGGKDLPQVEDTETCIRSNCIRRYAPNLLINQDRADGRKHVKVDWKPADAELFVILQAIG